MKLYEGRPARLIDESERMDPETLHHAQASRQCSIRHRPHQHVGGLRHQRDEVPERIVGRGSLWHTEMRLWLGGVDEIGKLHRVLNEKDRDVVAHEVPVALVRIKLDGKASNIARRIGRSSFSDHSRESGENRRPLAGLGEYRSARDMRHRLVAFEVAMGTGAPSVDDSLGDSFVVEVSDLFAKYEIFQ